MLAINDYSSNFIGSILVLYRCSAEQLCSSERNATLIKHRTITVAGFHISNLFTGRMLTTAKVLIHRIQQHPTHKHRRKHTHTRTYTNHTKIDMPMSCTSLIENVANAQQPTTKIERPREHSKNNNRFALECLECSMQLRHSLFDRSYSM